jgi:hypothetical protein
MPINQQVVKPGQLTDAISDVLNEYKADIVEVINEQTEKAAKELKKAIAADAPVLTGKQKKSWRITTEKVAGIDLKAIVHSTDYRKVHLLENGHLLRNGKRTRAFHYISNNSERILQEYYRNVTNAIEGVD